MSFFLSLVSYLFRYVVHDFVISSFSYVVRSLVMYFVRSFVRFFFRPLWLSFFIC